MNMAQLSAPIRRAVSCFVPPASSWRTLLQLSASHVSCETRALLNSDGWLLRSEAPIAMGRYDEFGWFLWVPDELEQYRDLVPADLHDLPGIGQQVGAEFVLLDGDADEVDGLRTYETPRVG